MRTILFGWIVFVCALPGLSLGFVTEVALGWGPIDPADLNLFVGAANSALEFFRDDLGAQGEVPPLEWLDDALSLGIGEGLDLGVVLEIEMTVFKAEVATSGTYSLGGQDYLISLSLSLRNMRLGVGFSVPLFGKALTLGISGGMARADVGYVGHFPYPEDNWTFAYVPPSGEIRAEASSFYMGGFMRAALGIFPGVRAYLEIRGHWQPGAPLVSAEGDMDLNGDDKGDRLGFFGFWLIGGIQIWVPF